jgi:hypothetical protein
VILISETLISSSRTLFILKIKSDKGEESPGVSGHLIHEEVPQKCNIHFSFEFLSE